MSPITHFLCGWAVANTAALERRERAAVALAGVAPDVDGLGIVVEALTRDTAHPLLWWSSYHHTLGHNGCFGLALTAVAFAVAKSRWKTAGLACLSFHLHMLCDLAGSRGPDGEIWEVAYLYPFSGAWTWTWEGQWALNAWPNFVVTGVLLALTLHWARRKGHSPLEIISLRADAAFVGALRARFPIAS